VTGATRSATVRVAAGVRGDGELAVVFERGCPNNSVPILWGEATTPKWMALSRRG
jgi:hypothetical protein